VTKREVYLGSKGEERGIRPPTAATLKKYGMVALDWLELMDEQGWKCPVCLKRVGVTWNIDHAHVPRWKHLPPVERLRFVRGILCAWCNHRRVNSSMSAAEAQRIADYFKAYETRRNDGTQTEG